MPTLQVEVDELKQRVSALEHEIQAYVRPHRSLEAELVRFMIEVRGRFDHLGAELSSFTVDQRLLSFDVEVRDDPRMGLATLSVDSSSRTTWSGFSYAYKLSDRISIGMTGFLSVTRTQYRDELIATDLGEVIEESGAKTFFRVIAVKSLLIEAIAYTCEGSLER